MNEGEKGLKTKHFFLRQTLGSPHMTQRYIILTSFHCLFYFFLIFSLFFYLSPPLLLALFLSFVPSLSFSLFYNPSLSHFLPILPNLFLSLPWLQLSFLSSVSFLESRCEGSQSLSSSVMHQAVLLTSLVRVRWDREQSASPLSMSPILSDF